MGQIYLVRHGQASFGSKNYDQLSELGAEQARLLGEWFANSHQKFDRVVTGSLKRHRQTADACLMALPKALRVETEWEQDPDFDEYNHHEVMVRHRPDFEDPEAVKRFLASGPSARHAFQEMFEAAMTRWMDGEFDADYDEPWPAFKQRCVNALQRLLEGADKSQSIIVFTSGGTISAICQHLLKLPDRKMAEMNWSLVNCGVTKLLYRPGRVTLSYLNNYSHLEWLGQPNTITYR
ncbi:histidine phosphatase family protein [Noviherbaspirillum sp.]|jgi:broad specificity phosphatase PhoE|uniref:histidine phosphatase family protein n=1 Tax=Noviherbaspirillum sp. TaxID=1926288 RepID=UPI0025D0BE41|nr:histidine phosphatase family protein [Noviherbaspirillum sp.]